ncbi:MULTISPECIES: magnesium-translocating P-type ATPase [unclassified Breznakia]|uniref:magnesium-translocating P-type ATPase n=1 Tax=unclassified Breznakia TaxID=2623764 RepID=UPI002475557B|nr:MULTISPECIES: magnesium-translocating P-type ATPase [unclassified Breznakia]MDH6366868.1 Mg2+-importing ATPase [Breznakia sp. PH1-1]MDH6404046.1 Mg2+-importing ATPase [Breznakia sp. PF1-11]MDH6411732.1 Mg2+-importing ATPase [Breznakia sp. PFB1-11]MDH6414034.1 Mg2+-importing ATPase [Breznakia sp. PFB1-14]MDH6416464.1 Mg2+-importing ATPase [Breznakia sp. PFB1-4]
MTVFKKHKEEAKKAEVKKAKTLKARLKQAAKLPIMNLLDMLDSGMDGFDETHVEEQMEMFGENVLTSKQPDSVWKRLFDAFINPFSLILIILVVISYFTDVVLMPDKKQDWTTIIIVSIMVISSGLLRFIQESRSSKAAEKLNEMIENTTRVKRKGKAATEVPINEIVVGDIVYLAAGDMIPADMRLFQTKDLFIQQSSLTGESAPVEKFADHEQDDKPTIEYENLVFMGSDVVSGSAIGVVVAVGDETLIGSISQEIQEKEETSFEKGMNHVSWILIRFMLIMVPIVFFINGFSKGDFVHALMFAISIAVGLTPEMLPMITTTCLAKGSYQMSKQKVIVKNVNSIQNFGAMDILCTDKTGTITQDKVVLQYNLDVNGNEDDRVLRHGFLNSYYQTGLKNFIDIAIINKTQEKEMFEDIVDRYEKVDEIPFDFNRRRMSVVVKDHQGKVQLITKGAVEEILHICTYVELDGQVTRLREDMKDRVVQVVDRLNKEGMRVIAVAQKTNPKDVDAFGVQDEQDMVLIGYLAFLDPPKPTTKAAIEALHYYGVNVKVLTGDNDVVTQAICKQVGMDVQDILLGSDLEKMSDEQIKEKVDTVDIYAKLSPQQKSRLVRLMKEKGHAVGFMGDGINDALAMNQADIGISVDTAVDIAKESADIILLEKDLMVLEKGILEGRKTYGNMMKYVKITASSNFGNMFSVLIASAFLPFLPMDPVQLILLNLVYDLSCTAIPWDHMDPEYLLKPRRWQADGISSFMKYFGPISSIFDILTYLLLYFVICPMVCNGLMYHQISDPSMQLLYVAVFQTGWLIESMCTQTFVIWLMRTSKIPFIQSRPSAVLMSLTTISVLFIIALPYTPLASYFELTGLPVIYFAWMFGLMFLYFVGVSIMKKIYIRKYGELL